MESESKLEFDKRSTRGDWKTDISKHDAQCYTSFNFVGDHKYANRKIR